MEPDRLRHRWAIAATALAAAGLLVRFTVRDRVPLVSALYYGLPLAGIAVLFAVAAAFWWDGCRPRAARICLACALLAAAAWVVGESYRHDCEDPRGDSDTFRVLTWNVAHGMGTWDAVVEAARPVDADVIGLIEAGADNPVRRRYWESGFPGYELSLPGKGLAVLVRGEIVRDELRELGQAGRVAIVDVEFRGGPLRVLLVDLFLTFFDTERAIDRLVGLLEPGVPTLVMGDFNTPVDAVRFASLRRETTHAFEAAGHGLLVTWPAPIPILAIDHVWVSPELEVRCARTAWSVRSDHLQLITELSRRGD